MKQAKNKTEKNKADARDDKLALMVQRGFLEMNDKFIEVNRNISQMKEEIGGLKEEMGSMKGEIGGIREEIGSIREEIGDLSERVEKVEDQVNDVLNNQDKMIKDLEDLKEENTMDIVIHGRMEKRILHLEREMVKVKAKVKV